MKYYFLLKQYLLYKLRAKSAHGIHSPFVYEFITAVLQDKRRFYAFDRIADIRKNLLNDHRSIHIDDLGAGSLSGTKVNRTIREIARTSGRNQKYGELLFRIVHHYGYRRILELGTSLGLGTLYLAAAVQQGKIITIEGSPEIASGAGQTFATWPELAVQQLTGNFDDVLSIVLSEHPAFDLVVVDGNHRKEPTLRYFHQLLPNIQPNTLVIFDDIHWSSEMHSAWDIICRHPDVRLSIDLFQFGLIFFDPSFHEKQHFTLAY